MERSLSATPVSAVLDPADPERLLTVADLAQKLNVGVSWVYAKVESRELPYVRLGQRYLRFRPSDIESYLRSQQRGAEAK